MEIGTSGPCVGALLGTVVIPLLLPAGLTPTRSDELFKDYPLRLEGEFTGGSIRLGYGFLHLSSVGAKRVASASDPSPTQLTAPVRAIVLHTSDVQ
jgi:hypothetical protein